MNDLISLHLKAFFQSFLAFPDRLSFICLSFIFLLLPGNNYYLSLLPQPQEPWLREIVLKPRPPALYPLKKQGITEPHIQAKAAVVLDVHSAVILYEKNSHQSLKPASTTKIMTALVALEHYPLNKILTVKNADKSVGQTMDLSAGEQINVENLLYGLLLHSGNDAAYALAENYDGGYSAFVSQMNNKAAELHLENTHFQNVSGIDQLEHYTTVSDLAKLGAESLKNPIFLSMVSTKEKLVTDITGNTVHLLVNKNKLLGEVEGIRGIKTGWTENAGECLVTDTVRNDKEIITVVLGSQDRFSESKILIEWAFQAFDWKKT